MLLFSKRALLESEYKKWIKENSNEKTEMKDCALSVISFLYIEGLLDEEKVLEYIKKKEV